MQSAFLKGRSIHDNTILAHEIFHSMKHKQGRGGLMAVKLDMEKAFDSMEWGFLLEIMKLLGFSSIWINWIINASLLLFSPFCWMVPLLDFLNLPKV
jgi:hypothetical protein